MNASLDSKNLERWSAALATLILMLALGVIAGWILHIRALVQPVPQYTAMQFNTALCFVLLSLPLTFRTRGHRILVALVPVVIIAALNLLQELLRFNTGIDELFITHFIQAKTSHPGRMAPNSAIAFLLGSSSLLLVLREHENKIAILTALMLASMTMIFGAGALVGYLSGIETSYGWGNVTQMAINTAVGFTVIGCSALLRAAAIARDKVNFATTMPTVFAGFLIALFGMYLWQALSRDETDSIHRSTTIAVESAKDRLETRLSEVSRALRRMAERVAFGMDARAWQRDAEFYANDFPAYDALFITDEHGTIIEHADALADNEILAEILNHAWTKRRRWGKEGAEFSELIRSPTDDLVFLVTLPIVRQNAPLQYLAVLINAGEFFGQILGQSFVAPGYSLSATSNGTEFVRRVASGFDSSKHWSIETKLEITLTPWVLKAWPDERTFDNHTSPLPLVVLCSCVTFGLLVMFAFHLAASSRQARAMAELATEAKSNFLANMSHEIRTPLTAILGFTETLLAEDLPAPERRDALQTVERNSKHLLRLINDILDLSKIEAKKMEIDLVRMSLAELLSDISNFVRPQAQAKKISFGFEYAYPVPLIINTDPVRLKQILINLIGNAIKFTQTGGVKVQISYAAAEQKVSFTVVDTGIGITEEQKSRLFRAFSQADASTTRKFGGTGLGLIISAQLAERLGGEITLESSPGRGSAFTATIYVGPVLDSDLVYKIEEPKLQSDVPVRNDESKLTGRVLVAEDGIDNQRYVSFLLNKLGVDVTLVDNGAAALEKIQESTFDLILMDMQMPVMDGYTAMAELREKGCNVPIIAFTANAMRGDIERCREAGSTDFLGKPFSRQEFFDKVRRYLPEDESTSGKVNEMENAANDSAIISNDPAYLHLVAMFEQGLIPRLDAITRALERADFTELEALAHQLRGCGGLYGHFELSALCAKLEKGASQRRDDLTELVQELARYVKDHAPAV